MNRHRYRFVFPRPGLGRARRAPNPCKDLAVNLRFRTRFGPKAGPKQAQNIRHGTHKPAHNDSERFWPDFDGDPKLLNCEIAQPSLGHQEQRAENEEQRTRTQNGAGGRKSGFRAGFRTEINRENLKIGPPAGGGEAGGPIVRLL